MEVKVGDQFSEQHIREVSIGIHWYEAYNVSTK